MNDDKIEEGRDTCQSDQVLRDTNLSTNLIKEDDKKKENEEPKKVNSFVTILAVWGSLIGSSTVSMPYNVYQAGIVPSIVLCIIYGFLAFYTCKIYVDFGVKEADFSSTVERYFGKVFGPKIGKICKNIQIIFIISLTTGGFMIYFLIMSQNLYSVSCLILNNIGFDIDEQNLKPEFGRFSIIYLGFILSILIFPLIMKKEVSFLVKISSFSAYCVSALIIYAIYTGISSMINTDFHIDYIKNKKDSKDRYIQLFGINPSNLAGTISLGYFCHSTILPTLKNNKNQNNNIRDLSIGYIFTGFTFSLSGIFGYIGFSGKDFDIDFKKNWFFFFDYDVIIVLILKLLNIFQLFVVFPILVYAVRLQIFNFFYGNDYPSKKLVMIYSISALILSLIVVYIASEYLAELIGIIGACTTLILVYTFPPIVKIIALYLKKKKISVENETNLDENREKNADNEEKEKEEKEETEETEESNKKEGKNENEALKEGNDSEKFTFIDILYIIGHLLFIVIGIVTVVFNFVPINFFNVTFREE